MNSAQRNILIFAAIAGLFWALRGTPTAPPAKTPVAQPVAPVAPAPVEPAPKRPAPRP